MFKIYSHELRWVALKNPNTQSLPRKMYVSTLYCTLVGAVGKGAGGRAAVHAASCLQQQCVPLTEPHARSLFPLVTREGCTSFWLQKKTCGLPDSQAPREHLEA